MLTVSSFTNKNTEVSKTRKFIKVKHNKYEWNVLSNFHVSVYK